jgi:L-aminopeptidase/D-esterase-like protein
VVLARRVVAGRSPVGATVLTRADQEEIAMSSLESTPSGKPRARGIGIPFLGTPGRHNAITDVAGVSVGYTTLIEGDGVRTGVTAILPRPLDEMTTPVFAGCHSLNGNGELTGTIWMDEAGRSDGPITITNTHSLGVARDASIRWMVERSGLGEWALPVAGETFDGVLNDINGFHVTEQHVLDALDSAASSLSGPIDEGSVGGGTGMICYGFKGGSGTSSRVLDCAGVDVTVGAFVQANFGRTSQLTIAGVPVGRRLQEIESAGYPPDEPAERGSIIAIVATDAPLLPHQLKRLARRVGLGMGRSGAISGHGSGDIFMAFSTANAEALQDEHAVSTASFIPNAALDPVFAAVIESIDEAILNALVANESMTGFGGRHIEALPHDRVLDILRAHGVMPPRGE